MAKVLQEDSQMLLSVLLHSCLPSPKYTLNGGPVHVQPAADACHGMDGNCPRGMPAARPRPAQLRLRGRGSASKPRPRHGGQRANEPLRTGPDLALRKSVMRVLAAMGAPLVPLM